ncbi:MAG: class I SAM-dependent methyltransferase [Novosphingobium sp.]|nr:class I SAM-dependent methyltransferase [Novosphingobium sp.]
MSESVIKHPLIHFNDGVEDRAVRWRSESGAPPPRRVVVADDTMTADSAYRLAAEGVGLLWRSDYQNARQLLQALVRRVDKPRKVRRKQAEPDMTPGAAFHRHRQAQAQRAHILSMLLIPFEGDYGIPLSRAPDVRLACSEAWGEPDGEPSVVSLRELLGLIGAHEWRKKGVEVRALGAHIHPYYGVFAPIRSEYVTLLAGAPLPTQTLAFDIGTGTGVLAAVLAKRGVAKVIATENDPRALECARDNIARLGMVEQVEVVEADLFPEGRAPLIICNPPWIPSTPSAPIERAIYDAGGRMLRGFLNGLAAHLEPEGEGWLILSDIAEHLGLRTRDELLAMIDAAGLKVLGRKDIRPQHPKAIDKSDPLHAARSAEITSLWRLGAR